ncbi:MAG: DUF533 domain-containing protein [Pseudomonadota bacterium]
MSLKRMAVKMAIAFAAAKGYQAYRQNGGMSGIKQKLSQSGGSGGAGGMLGGAGGSGGLGGLLSSLGGGAGGGAAASGGLLGGLAAMAGGRQDMDAPQMMAQAESGPDDEDTAAIMIRAIGQAVRADGQIDAEERAALNDLIGQADTEEERAVIDVALTEPIHPEALARDVPRGHEGEVYAAALTAIDPDHPAEQDFLRRFATALALGDAEVARLHVMAGKPL